ESGARPIEGWFHVLWVDPAPGYGPAKVQYELVDDRGHGRELEFDPGVAARWGGPRGLDGRKVRVEGSPVAGRRLRVRSIEPVAGPAGAEPLAVQTGSRPFVTILCKFSDIAYEHFPMATYRQWTTGTTYPSLDHYWRELSYNQMNMSGSALVGWYILPHPKSYYYDAATGNLALDELATDCTSAADPQVNFPQFYGINLQLNGGFGSYTAFGGSWTLTADGQTKRYGMTWLGGSSLYIYAHEEGHALGLPHSSGPYDQTYDSHWDVMSGLAGYWTGQPVIPVHTISYHKNLLGWIPAARKLTVGQNTSRTITLERLALPGSGNYLMAQIPMDNAPGQFYTVEARRRVSYDDSLPGNAVVLHRVDPDPNWDRQARVVDVDNNGDPNDAAAMWTPGETFTDAANGITVKVNAQTATGFQVTITRSAPTNVWLSRASMAKARSAFALALAGGRLYAIGGKSNGANLAAMEAYNPTSNTWTGKAAVPGARYDGDGAVANSTLLYLPGGRNSAGTLTKTLYAYNLSTNAWSTKASLPTVSGCGASAIINGLLYVLTGCDGT
ncbi:MAG TPA: kelch repeat-containing protein, partial [Geobacteraceae bacterium]